MLRLYGLDENAKYKAAESNEIYTGAALMSGGILLPKIIGDDAAFEICLDIVS